MVIISKEVKEKIILKVKSWNNSIVPHKIGYNSIHGSQLIDFPQEKFNGTGTVRT